MTTDALVTADTLVAPWTEIGDKLVTLAEAVPESRYDAPPVPGVRSFADQLRHVAFWNGYVLETLRGAAADGAANELPRDAYPTKAKVIAVLRSSFDDVAAELRSAGASTRPGDVPTLVSFIAHGAEHYGQLVVYARLNGVVPPASREAA